MTLTELQAEAAELYPMPIDGDPTQNACAYAARHAHIAAKSVDTKKIYAASQAIGQRIDGEPDWRSSKAAYMQDAREALIAAEFFISEQP